MEQNANLHMVNTRWYTKSLKTQDISLKCANNSLNTIFVPMGKGVYSDMKTGNLENFTVTIIHIKFKH